MVAALEGEEGLGEAVEPVVVAVEGVLSDSGGQLDGRSHRQVQGSLIPSLIQIISRGRGWTDRQGWWERLPSTG